jgi:hypothetical protein
LSTVIRSSNFHLDNSWPRLDRYSLSLLELQRDPYYTYLPEEEVSTYVEKAIEVGIAAATNYIMMDHLTFFRRVMQAGLRIQLCASHPEQPTIRAQYHRKKQTIFIYKNSMTEIKQWIPHATELDLLALHTYHEWFHHLETTTLGKTDRQLPAVTIKRNGPFIKKRRLAHLREIAAHAFTETALRLDWSPLLLDQYRYHLEQGRSKAQIRELFYAIMEKK